MGDHQKHREQKTKVADAVEDEGFFAGFDGGEALVIEADQEIRGQADAFPADEHEQEVFC